MNKTNLLGMTIEELKNFAVELGEKPFRGKQLFKWIYRGERDFEAMTDFSLGFRSKLAENAYIGGIEVIDQQVDSKDGTRKFLFGLEDGNAVEGVFMKYHYGNSICISSQVGCRMGCVFCASGLDGLVRNLTAGEMIGQIYKAEEVTGQEINHVVIMGTGEPMDNYENVSKFLRLIHDPQGRNMSYRNITVSTSGIVPAMEKFGDDFPQVNLAISLHRLTDEGRSALMPVNKAYPLDQLLDAARRHGEKTGRRVTFEYTLIKGENDRDEDVALMKKRLGSMLCHVNLIPLNEVKETGLSGSSRKRAEQIAAAIEKCGITATVRREMGAEIDGACGQLRLKRSR
ncbi:MAG: 23S rRNA (adenine(2503)-C(2))-methyltransferase RlmN [Eubacterium sp.]|nr:23S rRNA (adenine(2503)-C(2))-methyltransferase RlmN [Candidatus Colimonas fimequi]